MYFNLCFLVGLSLKKNYIIRSHNNNSQKVQSILFNLKSQQEILRNNVIADMKDITTLVGERYLTGFLINAIYLK